MQLIKHWLYCSYLRMKFFCIRIVCVHKKLLKVYLLGWTHELWMWVSMMSGCGVADVLVSRLEMYAILYYALMNNHSLKNRVMFLLDNYWSPLNLQGQVAGSSQLLCICIFHVHHEIETLCTFYSVLHILSEGVMKANCFDDSNVSVIIYKYYWWTVLVQHYSTNQCWL